MTALRVAAFEFRQQLRGQVFWVVFAVSALMVLGSLWIDELRVGLSDEGLRNGSSAIARTHLVWSLFFMFTAAAFVSDAALRDHASGFAQILEAMPSRRRDLLLGRFAGAFAAVAFCFLSVPSAMALGSLALWAEPEVIGPFRPPAYLLGFFALALPNLFLVSAAFFALAVATRSLAAAMLGAVVLLVLYGLAGDAGGRGAALVEPFGFVAHARALEGWTPTARDARVPALAGALLLNRLAWIAVGGTLVAAALFIRPRAAQPTIRRATAPDRPVPGLHDFVARPRFTVGTSIAQFAARTRFEVGQIGRSPVFAVLLFLGTANAGAALWAADTSAPGPTIRALIEAFRLLPTVIALFFAGELVWNEHQRRIHELVGTAPMPDAAFLLPKLFALVLVLATLALAGAAVAAGVQVVHGNSPDVSALLRLYTLPAAYDWTLVAALALFFQSLAPNKLAGWGFMVLYLIASLGLQRLGYDDPLYRYGRYPGWPLPPAFSGADGAGLYRAYWGAFAATLTTLAFGLVGRGVGDPQLTRLRRLPDRLSGLTGAVGAAAAAAFLALSLVIASGR